MKMPDVPGMDTFKGKQFHTARWDYEYTGGKPTAGDLDKLEDKTVGILGTGASAVQVIPHLAERRSISTSSSALQRRSATAATGRRRPISLKNCARPQDGSATGCTTFTTCYEARLTSTSSMTPGPTIGQNAGPATTSGNERGGLHARDEAEDFAVMEEHRAWIDEIVEDPERAEALKPYYRYLCKRPCFLDEYYPAFNRQNVTVVRVRPGSTG